MRKIKRETALLLSLAAAAFLPYLLYGFRYFPILDDYIQYWCYPAHHDLHHIYITIGTLSTRPIASLLDPAFWGRMWPFMWLAVLLITAMQVASAVLFCKALARWRVRLSPLFALIFMLLPLGMEGRFWLSASSRLVTGTFFAACSLYFLSGFLQEKQSLGRFLLFFVFQLISCGFYESVSVFSAAAACLLFLLSFYENRKPVLLFVPAVSAVNIGLMFFYYKVFAALGLQGSRASGGLALSALPGRVVELLRQLLEVFSLFYASTVRGCVLGVKLLFTNGVWGIFILLLVLCTSACIAVFADKRMRWTAARVWLFLIGGLILFFAPLAPNVLTDPVWLTERSLFVSIIGLALMAEPLFGLLRGYARQIVLFLAAFVLMTATVNEYNTYRRVHMQDEALLDTVIERMDEGSKKGEHFTCVIIPEEITTEQNAFYKDHVKSVFDSDWALTGAVRARMQSLAPQYIKPVIKGDDPKADGMQVIELTEADLANCRK